MGGDPARCVRDGGRAHPVPLTGDVWWLWVGLLLTLAMEKGRGAAILFFAAGVVAVTERLE
jgi:hypothetical protein